MRMQLMIEALAQAVEKAAGTGKLMAGNALDVVAIAQELETATVNLQGQGGQMRASDHQFQQTLVLGVMDKVGSPGVKFDVEGSGYGFRVVKTIAAAAAEQPTSCKMQRP